MPRKRRNWIPEACYHITHRCQNKGFLFRYGKYRDYYVRMLFKSVQKYRMDVLDYIVTSNHIHLLLSAKDGSEISNGLQYLHGRMGQWYNGQKKGTGSFWSDRFHSTRIQSGKHFAKCLIYIDLNMVRAGIVDHPAKWSHSAYSELRIGRQRCRIINRERLLACLGMDNDEFLEWHEMIITEKISRRELEKEQYWSRSVAVGDQEWLEKLIKDQGLKRRNVIQSGSECYIAGAGGNFNDQE